MMTATIVPFLFVLLRRVMRGVLKRVPREVLVTAPSPVLVIALVRELVSGASGPASSAVIPAALNVAAGIAMTAALVGASAVARLAGFCRAERRERLGIVSPKSVNR